MRRQIIDMGSYFFPQATKQCSISFAHRPEDIDETIDHVERALGVTA